MAVKERLDKKFVQMEIEQARWAYRQTRAEIGVSKIFVNCGSRRYRRGVVVSVSFFAGRSK